MTEIRKLRQKIGMTQQQLASAAGVTQAHIAKIESGKVDPRYSTIKKILSCLNREEKETCEKYMTRKIVTVSPRDDLKKAARIMKSLGISQLPVSENGKIIGLLTEENILSAISKEQKLKEIMCKPPPIFPKDTSIELATSILKEFPAILVSENNKIIGILTKTNLLKT